MANYLTIDIGNSSAKAAVWSGNSLAGPSIWGELEPIDIEHLCATAGEAPLCAAVCSVANDPHALLQCAQRLAHCVVDLSANTPLPIDISLYATQSTLGADRVAALCGAQALCPDDEALLVVDCGSAVTYDLLVGGRFLGGNIAPGIGMRLRALHAFTARLPQLDTDDPGMTLGLSTATAMQAGAFVGVAAETEYYLRHACPQGTRLVITGGRASDLAAHLHCDATFDPDLVLRGLKHIIDFNSIAQPKI